MNKPPLPFSLTFFIAYTLGILAITISFWLFGDSTNVFVENGPMENTQLMLLFLASLLFFNLSTTSPELNTPSRLIAGFFSWFAFACFIRELSLDDVDWSPWIISLLDGDGRAWLTIPLWVILLKMWPHRMVYWQRLPLYIKSPQGIYLMIAAVFLVAGWPLDKKKIDMTLSSSIFLEEALEIIGYYFILIAAAHSKESLLACQD